MVGQDKTRQDRAVQCNAVQFRIRQSTGQDKAKQKKAEAAG